jgi:HK97 family phage prohead protease
MTTKPDYLAMYRGTFGPHEPLPEWLVERDQLHAMQKTRGDLRRLLEQYEREKTAPKQKRRSSTVRRAAARLPAAPARRVSSSHAVRVAVPIDEVRSSDNSPGVLAGYAAMYGKPSVPLPFTEVLAPGAFRSTLEQVKAGQHDVLAFTEHDRRNLLGRVSAGNLKLSEDTRGLRFTLELPNTQLGRDTRELVQRGILKGMSFSFSVVKDSWGKGEGGHGRRTVHDLVLYEVSMVGSPAYPSTSVVASRFLPGPTTWHVAALRALAAKPSRASRQAVPRGTPGQIEHR